MGKCDTARPKGLKRDMDSALFVCGWHILSNPARALPATFRHLEAISLGTPPPSTPARALPPTFRHLEAISLRTPPRLHGVTQKCEEVIWF